MKLHELKQILSNKIKSLEAQKDNQFQAGDIEAYEATCAELEETRSTLEQIINI